MVWLLLLWALSAQPDIEDVLAMRRMAMNGGIDLAHPIPRSLLAKPYRAPVLEPWFLPYEEWETEYSEYFLRHYGDARVRFRPSAICVHFTVTSSATGVYNGFVRGGGMWNGTGVSFGHPSVHLMVDKDGTVYQLLPLDFRCTGAYGVNHKALSVELVALDQKDLLSRPRQLHASFCLVRWLMRRFSIPARQVYGHNDVSLGRTVVADFLDLADKKWPNGYPPEARRTDPGWIYLRWLHLWLQAHR
ncbi:N-acetylmuramoyl-L-alanine amidase [bacterium CPR1]|nr:N-acetylmuramoyl-L-alanine amidase [bacterium CPR1]